MELPEDLVEVAILPKDPDLDAIRPPDAIVEAIKTCVAGKDASEELLLWIDKQRRIQEQANIILNQLATTGELADPAKRGLPSWITQEWSMVLQFPWSHRLGWAVDSAKSWM